MKKKESICAKCNNGKYDADAVDVTDIPLQLDEIKTRKPYHIVNRKGKEETQKKKNKTVPKKRKRVNCGRKSHVKVHADCTLKDVTNVVNSKQKKRKQSVKSTQDKLLKRKASDSKSTNGAKDDNTSNTELYCKANDNEKVGVNSGVIIINSDENASQSSSDFLNNEDNSSDNSNAKEVEHDSVRSYTFNDDGDKSQSSCDLLNNENDSSDNSSDKEVGNDSANELPIDVIKKMNNVELKGELRCRGCYVSGVKAVLVARLIEAVKKNVPVNEFHDDKQHKKNIKDYAPKGTEIHFCAAGEKYCLAPFKVSSTSLAHSCSVCHTKVHVHCIGYHEEMKNIKCAKCNKGKYHEGVIKVTDGEKPEWWNSYCKNRSKKGKDQREPNVTTKKGETFFTADMFGLKVVANDLIGKRVGIIVDRGIYDNLVNLNRERKIDIPKQAMKPTTGNKKIYLVRYSLLHKRKRRQVKKQSKHATN